jgi:flagellin-like hook-associated protein FlgL
VSNIEEVKLHLTASLADTEGAAVSIAGVVDQIDQGIMRLRLVTFGSVHPKVEETINHLEQAKEHLRQAQSVVRGANEAAESYRSTI